MRTWAVTIFVVLFCTPITFARTWTDSTGKYTNEAEFVDFKDGKVQLKRMDGKTIAIPIEKLSAADQEYVRKQKTPVNNQEAMRIAKESFIASFKQSHAKKNANALSKLVFLAEYYPQSAINIWADTVFSNVGLDIKYIFIDEDESKSFSDAEYPLTAAWTLNISWGTDQYTSYPLGFKDGSYYFMLPKSMIRAPESTDKHSLKTPANRQKLSKEDAAEESLPDKRNNEPKSPDPRQEHSEQKQKIDSRTEPKNIGKPRYWTCDAGVLTLHYASNIERTVQVPVNKDGTHDSFQTMVDGHQVGVEFLHITIVIPSTGKGFGMEGMSVTWDGRKIPEHKNPPAKKSKR